MGQDRELPLTLFALAHACWLYKKLTDNALKRLHRDIGGETLNLELAEHRQAIIEFLNAWRCRQFATEYHDLASEEMKQWASKHLSNLPSPEKNVA